MPFDTRIVSPEDALFMTGWIFEPGGTIVVAVCLMVVGKVGGRFWLDLRAKVIMQVMMRMVFGCKVSP